MKILLFGPNGQVGWELQRSLSPLGRVISLDRQGMEGLAGNLTQPEGLAESIRATAPDVIVNAAAYTQVDQAESEPDAARVVNARAPGVMAREAAMCDAWLVHYSTDYVFSGKGATPWREDDTPEPVNFYGQTKLEGEEAVRRSGCRHLIFRTSWVYSQRGRNFLKSILRLASDREGLRVVDDQFGAPTAAELIADVTAHAIRAVQMCGSLTGTYHLAAAGETSWCGYARLVIEEAEKSGCKLKAKAEDIEPVPSEQFPTPAPRPRNSRLAITRLEQALSLHFPPWEYGVIRCLHGLCSKK